MKGEFRVGVEATFTIKRSEFGMKVMPGLSDEVQLTVSLEGVKQE
jgi:polyisoprenoid-binding protein YceI